ncbi:MAG: S8 family serine peptidase [Bacteroidia bacterium]
MKKLFILSYLMLSVTLAFAQKKAPENWFNLDYKKNKVYGVSTERAYDELLKGKTPKYITVAVIDGGIDYNHEDLKNVMWVNSKEKINNTDDDQNGYADDIYGWNFIGGKDSNYIYDLLEATRIYNKLKNKFEDKDGKFINENDNDFALFKKARYYYYKSYNEASAYAKGYGNLIESIRDIFTNSGKENPTAKDLDYFKPTNPKEKNRLSVAKMVAKTGGLQNSPIMNQLNEIYNHFNDQVKYNLDNNADPRYLVGDNYEDKKERFYGNNKVDAPNAGHGTHVAGIIAAQRDNEMGIKGVSATARIMALRVVPDGDERDKDIANAIIYAVDNGAKIINMSFGKPISPDKDLVDAAVKYAMSKDVLLVHAAGNDNKNIDTMDNYPTAVFKSGDFTAPNWIEVGASTWKKGKHIVAPFSNFGKNKVDVFAPGYDINSCAPGSNYEVQSGTSMAAPVTSGVAAILRSYYPHLTATQTKDIIMRSVVVYNKKVVVPGSRKHKLKLNELSKTGGIVNVYNAILLAEKEYKNPN